MRLLAFAVSLFGILCGASVGHAERLALVIGIDAYREVPRLEKAVGDARHVGGAAESRLRRHRGD